MTDEHLEKIERALAEAMPGPWEQVGKQVRRPNTLQDYGHFRAAPNGPQGAVCNCLRSDYALADAHLIAHAPTWLRALVDEVRELRAKLAAWQAQDDAIRATLARVTPTDKARDICGSIEQIAAERDEAWVRRDTQS